MRKRLLLFLLILLPIITVEAQDKFEPEWNVGVGFGPTFSNVDFVPFLGANPKTKSFQQYFGGIAVRYMTEKNVGIIAELNYSQQGWKADFEDFEDLPSTVDQTLFEQSRSLTYLELPILTHISFGKKVRFIVNLGPKVQFLVAQKEELSKEFADYIVNNAVPNNVTLHYNRNVENKFDYGLLLGAGMEFRTGIGSFALEGRYYFGLGDIYKNKKNDDNFSRSANQVLSAKLTYFVKVF